jgi:E3 ubiquitin-protein ligase UBR3
MFCLQSFNGHSFAAHYTCVIKCLYNLLYFESLLQVLCSLSEKSRAHFQTSGLSDLTTLEGCLTLLTVSLGQGQLFMDDAELGVSAREFDRAEVEAEVQAHCMPFLRVASLLRHHLYGEELPDIASEQREFVRLVYYLELVTDGMEWSKFNAAVALCWVYGDGTPTTPTTPVNTLAPVAVVSRWCEELQVLVAESQVASRNLVRHHQRWHQPRLLKLPDNYDKIFQYYHRRQCIKCHSVPRESSVCLLCGTIVCLKENCCKQQEVCEAVQVQKIALIHESV